MGIVRSRRNAVITGLVFVALAAAAAAITVPSLATDDGPDRDAGATDAPAVPVESLPEQALPDGAQGQVPADPRGGGCQRWVAPGGDDGGPGTQARPWRTLQHAADHVPDRGCTVWFEDGVYRGENDLERSFRRQVVFRAVHPYGAVIEGDNSGLEITGATHMTFIGFEFRHAGPGAPEIVVYVAGSDTHHIVFRNDIFHDSYNDDILKILDGAGSVTVRDSLFYNQGPNEQHIDVNSVTNVRIEGNIFFNDYSRSGRSVPGDTKAFIVVKDSNENDDGLLGTRNVTIARNVFLNWSGDLEPFLQIGNDGKPYFEARNVLVENNLLIGNSNHEAYAAFGVSGVRDVAFVNNTIAGDLPSSSYAANIDIKDQNPRNENITFVNNIWSDPTGTMDDFSSGDPNSTVGLRLDANLYWNGGDRVPNGEVMSPSDDGHGMLRDPRLEADQGGIVVPFWTGSDFLSGNGSIRQEFLRLVQRYGAIPATSPAVGRAVAAVAPARDILGHVRGGDPDLGAFEA